MELSAGDIFMAERLADLMSNYDYACIDGSTVIELAASLRDFLLSKGVQTSPAGAERYVREAGVVPLNP
ncbi:hypothetical protein [Actinoplanes couchii]|uniref:Uncharacterized protein n=1 Tax=Actinoplanes couchii TaxID=403638 RepID=A0ABQ3XQ57_9ACTN|nr:hypothetical protein [Actinoplanes couchii]MDR6322967.1 oligoribonuclease (3'-5' exoribonuclease) [Actinoplanes couchii]GID60641.1 hypothetical protein Aco03nite_090450 [Actinoplanes couchii]